MCRFIAYLGKQPLVLSELIDKPKNSLINQSRQAREGRLDINADGVGIAWYDHRIDILPGTYKSTQPAWNNQNLHHIITKIQSTCFLGHVRAATIGDVDAYNCHPFTHQQFSFVHNGTIRDFHQIKRQLLNQLSDESFHLVKGQTDSEHFFVLLMELLYEKNCVQTKTFSLDKLADAIRQTISTIYKLSHFTSLGRLNSVLTDGKQLIATRYMPRQEDGALSLYYSWQIKDNSPGIIIASEPLTDYAQDWHEVPVNHILCIDEDLKMTYLPMNIDL